jgi:predicted metal-dependent phosphoesterase TrpH
MNRVSDTGFHPIVGTLESDMLLADVHVHTRRSDGWFDLATLAEAALESGLDALVVTDHDDVEAGFALRDYVARRSLPLTVHPGSEITSRMDGKDVHILALGIEDNIAPWQSPAWTVEQIAKAGGIPVIAHPYKAGSGYLWASSAFDLTVPVAVEVFNASIADIDRLDPRARRKTDRNAAAVAFHLANREGLLGPVGGTDAHFRTVGRGLTSYRGDLLEAIRRKETVVLGTSAFERLSPRDVAGYASGLRSMKRRRAARWRLLPA